MTALASERHMAALLEKLQQAPSLAESLPSVEGEMVRAALNGSTIYEIAQVHEVTEAAVWEILGRVARAAASFGDIGNEAPNPNRSEPSLSEGEDAEDE